MSHQVQPRKLTPSGARKIPPNPNAPSLSHRREERLRPSDEKSAQGYDALEEANDKIDDMLAELADGAISVELSFTDTMVNIIANATDDHVVGDDQEHERKT